MAGIEVREGANDHGWVRVEFIDIEVDSIFEDFESEVEVVDV
jgi:hypothetical protein